MWYWGSDNQRYGSNVQKNSPIYKESSKITLGDDPLIDTTGIFDHTDVLKLGTSDLGKTGLNPDPGRDSIDS